MEYTMFYLMILLLLAVQCLSAPSFRKKQMDKGRPCSSSQSCAEDECCADSQLPVFFPDQICKKKPSVGSICDPHAMPGGSLCPCRRGLTCSLSEIHRDGTEIHRCIPLIEILEELEEMI